MKITAKNLIANGYRKYRAPDYMQCDGAYEKVIYDEMTGKNLYSIHIYRTDYSKHKNIDIDESWNSGTQFNMHEDETFNIQFFIYKNTELERVESFFHDVFYKFDCNPYDS